MIATFGGKAVLLVPGGPKGKIIREAVGDDVGLAALGIVAPHVRGRCVVAVGMIGDRHFGDVVQRGGAGRGHFRVVAVPIVGVDKDIGGHAAGARGDAQGADGARHVGGVVVVCYGSVAVGHTVGGKFAVRATDRAGIPNTDLDAAAVEIVGGRADQIRRAGDSSVQIHRRAVDGTFRLDVVEDGNLVARTFDSHRNAEFLGFGYNGFIADVLGFLHLGYREGALLRISEVFASENLRHRAVSSLPLRHTSGTTRTNC